MDDATTSATKVPWNKGKIVGQKAPLKLKDIWAIRIRLQLGHRTRELALFDLGLDSKLRACDLVRLRVRDICHGDRVSTRAIVMQQKTSQPVQFEITPPTREAVADWIKESSLTSDDFLFPSRIHDSPHLGTRQYARILDTWIEDIGLDPTAYGTHTMRRTKASLIYRRTKNIRAVQLLLGHTKLDYLPRRTMSRYMFAQQSPDKQFWGHRHLLQPFEKRQQSVIGSIPARSSLRGSCLVEDSLLYRQVGIQVDLRCLN